MGLGGGPRQYKYVTFKGQSKKELEDEFEGIESDGVTRLALADFPWCRVPSRMFKYTCITHLALSRIDDETIPGDISLLHRLRNLSIRRCENLKELPCQIWALPLLGSFIIENCPGIEAFPPGMEHATSLEELAVEFCRGFKLLPQEVCLLPKLRLLSVSGCKALATIPSCPGNFPSIKKVNISFCENLQRIPESFYSDTSIEFGPVHDGTKLDYVPHNLWKALTGSWFDRMFEGERRMKTLLRPVQAKAYLKSAKYAGVKKSTLPPKATFMAAIHTLEIFQLLLCARRSGLPRLPTELWLDIADTLYEMHLAELLPCLAD